VKGYTLDKLWIFMDDDEFDIDRRVLENNPLDLTGTLRINYSETSDR
jgi:hypothetical protein